MKNKFLFAWIIPLFLLVASCKKQENLSQEKLAKKIEKTDLIGAWNPVKTEVTGLTKSGIVNVVDSSENVKLYVPGLLFSKDEMSMGYIKGKYNINVVAEQSILTIELAGREQKFEVLRIKDLIRLKPISTSSQSTMFYFNKKAQ